MPEATEDLYFCPASREVESATGGGFATCCDRPQDHVPMPDTAATAAVSEALSNAVKAEFKLKQQLAELNHAITWETTCLNCSRLLIRSYEDYCRADALAAAVLVVANELTQSGVHDAAGQLGDALDRYQETAGERCTICGDPVEPLGMVLHFRAEHATAEDLAESTPLRTPATQVSAVAGPATRSEEGLPAAPTEFRWRHYGSGTEEWSRWHSLTGACEACCCRGPEECSPPDCTDREHREPGEPFGEYACVHNRMCQDCWRDEFDEPEGKVEYR